MPELDQVSCPACGSPALIQLEDSSLQCQHCQSHFSPKSGKANKGWWQQDKDFVATTATGECPICGKIHAADQTFRCKKCKRPFICLSHQDPETYWCQECLQKELQARQAKAEEEARLAAEQRAKIKAQRAARQRRNFGILLIAAVALFIISGIIIEVVDRSTYNRNSISSYRGNSDDASSQNTLLADPDYEDCVLWSTVKHGDAGKKICVYGVVQSLDGNDPASATTYVHFSQQTSSDSSDFRVVSWQHYFPGLKVSDCVAVIGTVRSNGASSFIYIDPASSKYPGDLFFWHDADYCQ